MKDPGGPDGQQSLFDDLASPRRKVAPKKKTTPPAAPALSSTSGPEGPQAPASPPRATRRTGQKPPTTPGARARPTASPAVPSAPAREVMSVSQLNERSRRLIESAMPSVWVEGEISNFSAPASGHWYFSLKDGGAQVRVAMFRTQRAGIRLRPRNGMAVQLRGRLTLYEARGEFQIVADRLEETGEGRLRAAFEALKTRLAEEGLFAAEAKQPIPGFARRIGLITSPTGAAVRDMLQVLARRFPAVPVRVYPIPVQGAEAAPRIVQALRLARRRQDCDVLIVGRGGGSLEDLWAFNEEIVARAIAACEIPVISAVGHEVDFTIADFVADVRAPTPSAAAELAVPDSATVRSRFETLQRRLALRMNGVLTDATRRLEFNTRRLSQQHPGARLNQHTQRLDELHGRLLTAMRNALTASRRTLGQLDTRLAQLSPLRQMPLHRDRVTRAEARLGQLMQLALERRGQQLGAASRALHAVSPLATLDRGYAIVRDADGGQILRRAGDVAPGTRIEAQLAYGVLHATVEASEIDPNEDPD